MSNGVYTTERWREVPLLKGDLFCYKSMIPGE
jgi:hypothetical protein